MLFPKRRDKLKRPLPPTREQIEAILQDKKKMKELRRRLGSVSWFMKCLNEYIAKRANAEDKCKGHFWEGRFKCQRAEDDAGVLACSVYIDLNPVRAGTAKTPEASEYTSVRERCLSVRKWKKGAPEPTLWIAPVYGDKSRKGFLPISLEEYLSVVDSTGRLIQSGKRGVIPKDLPPILHRLGVQSSGWRELVGRCSKIFSNVIGPEEALQKAALQSGRAWIKGAPFARLVFG